MGSELRAYRKDGNNVYSTYSDVSTSNLTDIPARRHGLTN